MSKMVIHKGFHYGCPFPFPWPYFGKKKLSKTIEVTFNNTIRYDIGKEDQMDVNKLMGFSLGWHHTDSDRFGFRYNIDLDKVEIVLYSYEKGVRLKTQHLCYVPIGTPVELTMIIDVTDIARNITASYRFGENCNTVHKVLGFKTNKWGYVLGLYFGGNQRAPHKIIIDKTK